MATRRGGREEEVEVEVPERRRRVESAAPAFPPAPLEEE
jgi:hypothetical protein